MSVENRVLVGLVLVMVVVSFLVWLPLTAPSGPALAVDAFTI